MAKKIQVVEGGVVVNLISVDDAATISDNEIVISDLQRIQAPSGATFMAQAGAGIGWTLSGETLAAPTPPALTKEQLAEYANEFQWSLATGGHNVTIGGTAYLFPTDTTSMSLMTGKAVRLQLPGAPTSVDWQLPAGYVTITAANFMTAAANIADWVQSTFEALKPVLVAIEAGTITTTGQIDAATWPAR